MSFWHWLSHITGGDNVSGIWYAEWSGFVGNFAIFASFFAAAYTLVRKHNCHQTGCWRVGRFQAGDYVVCRRHHPNPIVRGGVRAHHIRESHERRISS